MGFHFTTSLVFGLICTALWLIALVWAWRRHQAHPTRDFLYRDLLAGGALAVATLAFFWRTVTGDVFQPADGGDLVSFLFPTYRFAARELAQGTLPLWNPTLYGGAPFISDIQAGFLYPPNLLLFLTQPEFAYPTMQWLVLGHILWAGLGMYVLLRTLRWPVNPVSRLAALFGALAFMFCDPILVHLGNLNLIAVLSWLPWLLAAYHRALPSLHTDWENAANTATTPHAELDRLDDDTPEASRNDRAWLPSGGYGWLAVTSILFALANYAGHAQSSLYLGLALGLYTVGWALLAWPRAGWRAWVASGGRLAVVVALTVLLSAPILLPALEMTRYTERSAFTYQATTAFSLAPTQLLGILTPGFFGRGPALHWSLWDRVETPFAGVATALLAVGALLMVHGEARRRLWVWGGMAVVGLLIGMGVYTIVHGWLTLLIPPFAQMRAPARALILWNTGLAVMAAVGVDLVVRQGQDALASVGGVHWRNFMRRGMLIWFAIILPLGYFALLVTQENETAFLRTSVALLALVLAAVWWVMTWASIAGRYVGWWSGQVTAALLIAILMLDLTAAGAYTDISPNDPASGFAQPEIVDFLHADLAASADNALFRIDTRTDIQDVWQPDTAALYGLEDVGGIVNPLALQHWQAQWAATGSRATPAYDMLNVKYVIVRDGAPLPEGEFELVLDAAGPLSLYRHVDFMPRAWVVYEARLASNIEDALDQIQAADFDPRRTAIILDNAELAGATPFGPLVDAPPMGTDVVSLQRVNNHTMNLVVDAAAPGLLVLSEIWYPGWHATVHGATQSSQHAVMHANGALRAIPVPAGRSTVEMRFRPAGWRLGYALAGAGLIGIAGLLLRGQRLRRRQRLEDATGRIPAR